MLTPGLPRRSEVNFCEAPWQSNWKILRGGRSGHNWLHPTLIFQITRHDGLSMTVTGPGNLTSKRRQVQPGKIADLDPAILAPASTVMSR